MDFINIFRENTKIYRSTTDSSKKYGKWFGFSPKETYGYGNFTYEFKTKTDLKLLDITNYNFYSDFINRLNNFIKKDINIENLRYLILFPVGFHDYNIYREFAQTSISDSLSGSIMNPLLTMESQLFGNRYRCSLHSTDNLFMQVLQILYSNEADGFIADKQLPDRLRNGMHHKELCIFNENHSVFMSEINRTNNSTMNAGGDVDIYNTNSLRVLTRGDVTNHDTLNLIEKGLVYLKKYDTVNMIKSHKSNNSSQRTYNKTMKKKHRRK